MMKGLLAPQNTFLDTIATRFDGTRKFAFIFYFKHLHPLVFLLQVARLLEVSSRLLSSGVLPSLKALQSSQDLDLLYLL